MSHTTNNYMESGISVALPMIKNEETKDYSYSQGNTESQEKQKGTDNSCRIPTENLLDSPKEKAVMIKQPPQQIYGNPLLEEKPKCLGNAKAFLYIGRYPLITLGPDCKIYILIIRLHSSNINCFYDGTPSAFLFFIISKVFKTCENN